MLFLVASSLTYTLQLPREDKKEMITRSRSRKKQNTPAQVYEVDCQSTGEPTASAPLTGQEFQCSETGEREMVLVNVWSTGSRTPSCDTQGQQSFSDAYDQNSGHDTDSQVSQDEQRCDFIPPKRKGRKRRFVIPEDDEQELLRRTSSAELQEEKPGQPRKAKTLQDRTRERNRIAAQQCRWRLKKYVERLENAKGSQETLNAQLMDECSRLEREQVGLRNEESSTWQYLFEQLLPVLRNRLSGEDMQTLGALHTLLATPAPDVQSAKNDTLPEFDGNGQRNEPEHENSYANEQQGTDAVDATTTNPYPFMGPCIKAEVPCLEGGPQGENGFDVAIDAYDALIAQCDPVLTFEDTHPEPPSSPLVACAVGPNDGNTSNQDNSSSVGRASSHSTETFFVPQR